MKKPLLILIIIISFFFPFNTVSADGLCAFTTDDINSRNVAKLGTPVLDIVSSPLSGGIEVKFKIGDACISRLDDYILQGRTRTVSLKNSQTGQITNAQILDLTRERIPGIYNFNWEILTVKVPAVTTPGTYTFIYKGEPLTLGYGHPDPVVIETPAIFTYYDPNPTVKPTVKPTQTTAPVTKTVTPKPTVKVTTTNTPSPTIVAEASPSATPTVVVTPNLMQLAEAGNKEAFVAAWEAMPINTNDFTFEYRSEGIIPGDIELHGTADPETTINIVIFSDTSEKVIRLTTKAGADGAWAVDPNAILDLGNYDFYAEAVLGDTVYRSASPIQFFSPGVARLCNFDCGLKQKDYTLPVVLVTLGTIGLIATLIIAIKIGVFSKRPKPTTPPEPVQPVTPEKLT